MSIIAQLTTTCRNESTKTEMIVVLFGDGPEKPMELTEGEVRGLC